jgi:isopenicillin N synthase-like dioxygenase
MATQEIPEALTAPAQTFQNAPPFPDDVPTAPLLRLSLAKLIQRDADEVSRFVRACEDLGFFYLDLSGPGDSLLADADQLFKTGEELFDLPLEEKKKYDFMHKNSYFGYKGFGANVVDRKGNLDRNEFYNVSTPPSPFVTRRLNAVRYQKMTCLAFPTPGLLLKLSVRGVLS